MIRLPNAFTSFSFDGVESSTLGIVRVSNGNRYNLNASPQFKDLTSYIDGNNETYYWQTNYTQQTMSVNFVFDNMSDSQLRLLRQTFNGKNNGLLIFNEEPYKVYTAKCQSPVIVNFVCFDGPNGRIYKGEGTINFIMYKPMAESLHRYLNDYRAAGQTDAFEWEAGSGMLLSNTAGGKQYDTLVYGTGTSTYKASIKVYNAGDIETPFSFEISNLANIPINTTLTIKNSVSNRSMVLNKITYAGTDTKLKFNSKTYLIEGIYNNAGVEKVSTNTYNRFIASGDFFNLPVGESDIQFELSSTGTAISSVITSIANLDYRHLYY